MNWSTIQGNWNEAKGQVKTKWGKLTDDDLTQIGGHKDRLVGVLQQKYGIAKDKAEEQLDEFVSSAEGVIGKVKEGVNQAVESGKEYVEKGREMVEKGRDYVQNTSSSQMAADLKELAGRYPVQTALLGIGVGYLLGRLLTSATSNRS